ncbi:hypothetical protein SCB49_02129 [unidentified eubacterium SCB49]|nr:hypothetical protein SCB49_02129 [unidentified eubacterium SCB49]
MKHLNRTLLMLSLFFLAFISCETEDESSNDQEIEINEYSIIPSTSYGRPNNVLGCVEIASRITTIEVWDHGQIDGDIISIIANGDTIINEIELDGPSNPITVDYNFEYNGFNYITLYAHNLGDIPPNTCTIAINGVEFVLEANLEANGSVNIVVEGYGVDCYGATDGGGNDDGTGNAVFWINSDYNCGAVTVNLSGNGSESITSYFTSTPDCGTSGAANFSNLDPGTYSYTASCSDTNWSGTIDIAANTCSSELLLPGSGGGGGGDTTGDVKFWINHDFGCGNINVSVSGNGSSTITGYFDSAPDCDTSSGGGNFNNLQPGNYSFTASCSEYTWNGSLTVNANSCLQFQLN